MAKQSEYSAHDQLNNHVEFTPSPEPPANGKKAFIEPEISPAVDVLEATMFLQAAAESSVTN